MIWKYFKWLLLVAEWFFILLFKISRDKTVRVRVPVSCISMESLLCRQSRHDRREGESIGKCLLSPGWPERGHSMKQRNVCLRQHSSGEDSPSSLLSELLQYNPIPANNNIYWAPVCLSYPGLVSYQMVRAPYNGTLREELVDLSRWMGWWDADRVNQMRTCCLVLRFYYPCQI